jgi:hypothetical protein
MLYQFGMIVLSHSTRPKAIMQGGFGLAVLVGTTIFHPELPKEYGPLGYIMGGVLILTGLWSWFSALHGEKVVQEADRNERLTAADYEKDGIPGTTQAPVDYLLIAVIGLTIIGIFTLPLGVLFLAGSGALWWHRHKQISSLGTQGPVRFFPRQPYPVIGGKLRGEIRLPAGLQPAGPGRVMFACQKLILVEREKGPDRLDSKPLGESVQRLIEPGAWKTATEGLTATIELPIRGGAPSQGPVPPYETDKASVGWCLSLTLPVDGKECIIEFVVPVTRMAIPINPDIPPEIIEAGQDLLAPGNPTKIARFLADKTVEPKEVAPVASENVTAILAAANIVEVPKYGAVGGVGLQMDADASIAAKRFMNAGIVGALVLYAGLGLTALFLMIIPYVGWLLTLAALGLIVWALKRTFAERQQIARDPELLWIEPDHLCYLPDRTTEFRIPRTEIDRLEIQWVGSSGDTKYVKIMVAQAPAGKGAKRERTLLVHGVRGVETARAVAAWLLQRLGTNLSVVETQPGQDQLESLSDWVKDPIKR